MGPAASRYLQHHRWRSPGTSGTTLWQLQGVQLQEVSSHDLLAINLEKLRRCPHTRCKCTSSIGAALKRLTRAVGKSDAVATCCQDSTDFSRPELVDKLEGSGRLASGSIGVRQ